MSRNQAASRGPRYRPRPFAEIRSLADRIRSQARSGTSLQEIIRELRKAASSHDAAAALAYAVWFLKGEQAAGEAGDLSVPKRLLPQQISLLESAQKILRETIKGEREEGIRRVGPARSAPNHLSALVMRRLVGRDFQEALESVLEKRGMPTSALETPDGALLLWATRNKLHRDPDFGTDIAELLEADDEQFIAEVVREAADPGRMPRHPLVAARRVSLWPQIRNRARHHLGVAERELGQTPFANRGIPHFDRLRAAYRTRAALELVQRQSEGLAAEAERAALRLSRSRPFLEIAAECLQEAAEIVARQDPQLWQIVYTEVLRHQSHCPEFRTPFPCAPCVEGIVEKIRPSADSETSDTETDAAPVPGSGGKSRIPPAKREGALLVAVDARTRKESTLTGLAWAAGDGRTGLAGGLSGTLTESLLLAQNRGEKPAFSLSVSDVISPLPALVGQRKRIRVLTASAPHPLGRAAADLAALALRAERGQISSAVLKRKVAEIQRRISPREEDAAREPKTKAAPPANTPTRWSHALTESDLQKAELPLPQHVQDAIIRAHPTGTSVPVVLFHKSWYFTGGKARLRGRPIPGASVIRLHHAWPLDFFPGIILKCTWNPELFRLEIKTMRLGNPVQINGKTFTHIYDADTVVRRTAPGGPNRHRPDRILPVEQWILRTLQILGHLDAEEHVVVLAESSLKRNMRELGFPSSSLPQVPQALNALLRRGTLRRVTGSMDRQGRPVYPAVPGRPAVGLLHYRPVTVLSRKYFSEGSGRGSKPKRGHVVSGFVRRLPYGQSPSNEARQAHEEAVRRAELANGGPLPPGYTFVQKHERGTSRRRRKR